MIYTAAGEMARLILNIIAVIVLLVKFGQSKSADINRFLAVSKTIYTTIDVVSVTATLKFCYNYK